jgi:hypothetical protein
MIYGNQFVTTTGTSLLASTDGISWRIRTVPGNLMQKISYNDNLYVVSVDANDANTAISTDTIVWQIRTSGFGTSQINGVTNNGTVWVIGGRVGALATSTQQNLTSTGSGAFLRASTDSISWITRTAPIGTLNTGTSGGFSSAGSYTLAWGTNLSSNGFLIASTDNIVWELRTAASTISAYTFTYGNGIYLYATGGSGAVVTSTDTIVWTLRTAPGSSVIALLSSVYGSLPTDTFIVAGSSGYLATSTDSINWRLRTTGFGTTSINSFGLTYNDGLYTATIFSQQRTSTDGITWALRTSGFGSTSITGGAYGNNTYVIGGPVGTLATSTQTLLRSYGTGALLRSSTDTITWTTRTVANNTILITALDGESSYSLASVTNILNEYNIMVSTDNINWVLRTSGFGLTAINAFTYGSVYVAGGGGIITSTDTITWTLRTSGFGTSAINALVYTSNIYVAAGVSGSIRTSTDAIAWTVRSSGFGTTNINSLIYGTDFVAGGLAGTLTSASTTTQSVVGNGGVGTRGGGGGGGGYSQEQNKVGSGGDGGNGYVKITWW